VIVPLLNGWGKQELLNPQVNKESSHTERAVTAAIGPRHRIRNLDEAIAHLSGLQRFAEMDASLRLETDPLVAEMETAPLPHMQAFEWFNRFAEAYLVLVTDLDSWDSYRILLHQLFYPESSTLLFGFPDVVPQSEFTQKLDSRLRERLRYWHQKSSEKVAASGGQGRRDLATPLARNLNRLCLECGLSNEALAEETSLEKKLILRHILRSKTAQPKTLKKYADTFTRLLKRPVTPNDLLSD
jgi:hypothetical protein